MIEQQQKLVLSPYMEIYELVVPKDNLLRQIKELVDFIISSEVMRIGDVTTLLRLHTELIYKDWFMTLLDLKDYIRVREQMYTDYEDKRKWAKAALTNIAKAGFFSSDRTIEEYNRDIWKVR